MSGSMELFYIPKVEGDEVLLENEQFKHAIKAMRKREGDEIHFTDGAGVVYQGSILAISKRIATIGILHHREVPPPAFNVTLCVSLTKNMKRIEWAIEKITEMGISRITPIICHRSERATFNRDRLIKIMVSAMKQSQQALLPTLDEPMPVGQLLNRYTNSIDNSESALETSVEFYKYIAFKSDTSISLKDNYQPGSDVVLLIGPEGDFTEEELDLARKANFTALSLGHTRLRTETAAIAAVASVHAMNY